MTMSGKRSLTTDQSNPHRQFPELIAQEETLAQAALITSPSARVLRHQSCMTLE